MGLGDIRREDVLRAMALLDDPIEGPRLLEELHFKQAKDYRLVYEGRFYDSKAVVGIAHGLGAGGRYLTSGDFSGGLDSVVRVLSQLGFYVDAGFLYDITQLRVDRTHGRPAPYQYIVLLWAIARARSGLPRMVPFNDVCDELAQIIAPFALAQTAPDPAMPWFALRNSSWWELQVPTTPSRLTDADVQPLNLVAGLSESRFERLRDDAAFASAAVDVIGRIIGEEPAYDQLLDQLGLAPLAGEVRSAPAHHEDASTNSGEADGSRALIVTWNPDKGKWAKVPQGYHYAVEQTARGETIIEDWSTGVRNRGVSWGDRAFMLLQGSQGRGIIASGTVRGEIRQIPHWDPENHPGEIANAVRIEWERVVPFEDILPTEELNRQLPKIHWSPQSSGMLIEGESAAQLEDLWSSHLARMTDTATDPVLSTNALVWPMLQAMKALGRPAHIQEIDAAVIEQEQISPEVQAVPHGKGPAKKLNYRLRWSRTELRKMHAIDKKPDVNDGIWWVTPFGESLGLAECQELIRTRKSRDSNGNDVDDTTNPDQNSSYVAVVRADGLATFGRADAPIIEEVGRKILRDCLIHDGSLMGGEIWTTANLAILHSDYVDQPDASSDKPFLEKLGKQLENVPPEARQLFAELYVLNVLPISDLTQKFKLQNTELILRPIEPPDYGTGIHQERVRTRYVPWWPRFQQHPLAATRVLGRVRGVLQESTRHPSRGGRQGPCRHAQVGRGFPWAE